MGAVAVGAVAVAVVSAVVLAAVVPTMVAVMSTVAVEDQGQPLVGSGRNDGSL